jgi:hypothetical protein
MKTKTYSLLALATGLMLTSGTFNHLQAQAITKAPSSESEADLALQYFKQIGSGKGNLDECLKSIRPAGISAEQRVRLVASIRKQDIVAPSPKRQTKLNALRPVLEYHERAAVEVKILRFPIPLAWVGFLEGAAVVVSEDALDLLAAEELQAVIAHELGHEYFAAEFESARKNKQWDKVKEVELRCDAISVITMKSLGLNPDALFSGITKLTKFNEGHGVKSNPNLVTSLDDRLNFCKTMVKLTESRAATSLPIAGKRP